MGMWAPTPSSCFYTSVRLFLPEKFNCWEMRRGLLGHDESDKGISAVQHWLVRGVGGVVLVKSQRCRGILIDVVTDRRT